MQEKRLVTKEEISDLEHEEIIESGNFYVGRTSQVMDFLGVPTIIYAVDEYEIIDVFGYQVTKGNSEYIAEFMNGLNGFCEEE